MSNYKEELDRTEKQYLEIRKHIEDVKSIIYNKTKEDISEVNGLRSIKNALEYVTIGGYIVGDGISSENIKVNYSYLYPERHANVWDIKLNSLKEVSDIVCGEKMLSNDEVDGGYAYVCTNDGCVYTIHGRGRLINKLKVSNNSSQTKMRLSKIDKNGFMYAVTETEFFKINSRVSPIKVEIYKDIENKYSCLCVLKDGSIAIGSYLKGKIFIVSGNGDIINDIYINVRCVGIVETSTGDLCIVGDRKLIKIKISGDIIYTVKLNYEIDSITIDSDDGVYVGGGYSFNKISREGKVEWTYTSEYNSKVTSINVDSVGYIYTTQLSTLKKLNNKGESIFSLNYDRNSISASTVTPSRDILLSYGSNAIINRCNQYKVPIKYEILKIERG